MATTASKRPAKAAAKPQQTTRPYTVVRVDADGRLSIAEHSFPARRQEEACDQVVAKLPEGQRTGTFAAFLASSFKAFDYSTTQTYVTSKKPLPGGIAAPPTAGMEKI